MYVYLTIATIITVTVTITMLTKQCTCTYQQIYSHFLHILEGNYLLTYYPEFVRNYQSN